MLNLSDAQLSRRISRAQKAVVNGRSLVRKLTISAGAARVLITMLRKLEAKAPRAGTSPTLPLTRAVRRFAKAKRVDAYAYKMRLLRRRRGALADAQRAQARRARDKPVGGGSTLWAGLEGMMGAPIKKGCWALRRHITLSCRGMKEAQAAQLGLKTRYRLLQDATADIGVNAVLEFVLIQVMKAAAERTLSARARVVKAEHVAAGIRGDEELAAMAKHLKFKPSS